MFTKSLIPLIVTLILSTTTIPLANGQESQPCYKDGTWYEHGSIVDGYFCNNGQWEIY